MRVSAVMEPGKMKESKELTVLVEDAGGSKTEGSSRRPKYSKFTQQELPACKPLLTPKWVIGTFFVIGVIFIPIGGIALAASSSVVEVGKRYDDECFRSLSAMAAPGDRDLTSSAARDAYMRNPETDKLCTINLTIPRTMSPPIFVYYQLDNFYQNHRRYVKSRSDVQLRTGDNAGISTKCKPKDCVQVNGSSDGATGSCQPIVPCGLVAWSFFNDSYSLTLTSSGLDPSSASSLSPGLNRTLDVDEKGIAWDSDVKDKYGRVMPQNFNNDPATRGGSTLTGPINQNEHFIVWMRTAALPSFRKLWGKVDEKLYAKSEISVTIVNQYNTYTFGGKKKLILSTGSWLGGANNFLGIAYLTVGALCMLSSFLFFLIHWRNPRPLGDTSYLSWNRKQEA
ncbi:hypothetical protein CBR_g12615 [Chara braunii]|uniref:ALA-interacting subunit n=1 Tax=Chara braunii TaxID=69332 RepID=A0A388KS44_CHABU|nr:hypothetical protein CBR_g12615 [Chara braunii]|eukprot:GBG72895.1 hypothetical protein CBR_g12615 [Chara braunii]